MTSHAGTWKDYGSCASIGPSDYLWYPSGATTELTTLLRICNNCEVQYECLTEALNTIPQDDYGWWAGNSPNDRKALRTEPEPHQRLLGVSRTATPHQAATARRHHADGRGIAWIAYALHLTGPAVRRALRGTKTRRAAA